MDGFAVVLMSQDMLIEMEMATMLQGAISLWDMHHTCNALLKETLLCSA